MNIELSSDEDLAAILAWLKPEYDQAGHGFYANREIISKSHVDRELHILRHDHKVVAFVVGRPGEIAIFEVHPEYRGYGFGRTLAEYSLSQALEADVAAIEFECSPASSLPFWKKMGFFERPPRSGSNPWAIIRLHKSLNLPVGKSVNITIKIMSEEYEYDENIQAIAQYSLAAVCDSEGVIWLPHRVPIVAPEIPQHKDVALEIICDGETIIKGKAKYEAQRHAGVRQDSIRNFYIDKISLKI